MMPAVRRPLQAHLAADAELHTISKASRQSRDCIDAAVIARETPEGLELIDGH